MSKFNPLTFGSDLQSRQNLNSNFTALQTVIEDTLSRSGTTPNQMQATLDMNSNRIINLPAPQAPSDPARLQDIGSNISVLTAITASVASYAALRAYSLTGLANGIIFFVQGVTTAGDGGEGFFRLTSTNPGADNGGTLLWSATGGKYFVRVYQGPIHDLWFGVKGDGSTDNSAALQATLDYANSSGIGAIYFPPTASARAFATGLTLYSGIKFYGSGFNAKVKDGVVPITAGPCHLLFTNTTSTNFAFTLQAPSGSPSGTNYSAPSFYDMNISSPSASCIKLNDKNGGFDYVGVPVQGPITNGGMFRCHFYSGARGNSTMLQMSQVLDFAVKDCYKMGFDYGIDMKGCDNIWVADNHFNNATICDIYTSSSGTFGNEHWIERNVLSTPYTNAGGMLVLNSRSVLVRGNYFEAQNTLNTTYTTVAAAIQIQGGLNVVIEDNQMDCNSAQCPTWLFVNTGAKYYSLKIENNFSTGASTGQAQFYNVSIGPGFAGDGFQVYSPNAIFPCLLSGGHNVNNDDGIPYFSDMRSHPPHNPSRAGYELWRCTPANNAIAIVAPTTYYANIVVNNLGYWVIPPASGTTNRVALNAGFDGAGPITDTVDVWVEAYTNVAGQVLFLDDNTTTTSQALTTTPTWYKMVNARAVAPLTNLFLNNPTGLGGYAYVRTVLVVKT